MPVAELGEGEYAMLSEGRKLLAESRTQVGALASGVNDQVEDAGGLGVDPISVCRCSAGGFLRCWTSCFTSVRHLLLSILSVSA